MQYLVVGPVQKDQNSTMGHEKILKGREQWHLPAAVLSLALAGLDTKDLLGICLRGVLYLPYGHTHQLYTSLCQTLRQQICDK